MILFSCIPRCPNPQACHSEEQQLVMDCQTAPTNAEGGHSSPAHHNCSPSDLATAFGESQSCTTGYEGNVCGTCSEGCGMSKLFTCSKCYSKAVLWVLYVVAILVISAVVRLLLAFTLRENSGKAVSRAAPSLGAVTQTAAPAAEVESALPEGAASTGKLRPLGMSDHAKSIAPGDVVKCVILYTQYIVLLASLQVEWPRVLSYPFQFVNWLSPASASQTVSLECVLRGERGFLLPVGISQLLVFLVLPLLVYVSLVLLEVFCRALRASSCRSSNARRSRVTMGHVRGQQRAAGSATSYTLAAFSGVLAMVVLFTFLPGLARSALGLFMCLPLDNPAHVPYAYTGQANGTFWISDLNQSCWSGYHRSWALGLGVPLTLVLCVVLPVSVFLTMFLHRARLQDPAFRRHFGFLYHNYRPAYCAWEAVVILQTLCIVSISVYGLKLGAYYQALLMNAVLAFMLLLQTACKPHASWQLHRLYQAALGCLLLTSYAAMSFLSMAAVSSSNNGVIISGSSSSSNSYNQQAYTVYKATMGVIVLLANVGFMAYALMVLFRSLQWSLLQAAMFKFKIAFTQLIGPCCSGKCAKGEEEHEQGATVVTVCN